MATAIDVPPLRRRMPPTVAIWLPISAVISGVFHEAPFMTMTRPAAIALRIAVLAQAHGHHARRSRRRSDSASACQSLDPTPVSSCPDLSKPSQRASAPATSP